MRKKHVLPFTRELIVGSLFFCMDTAFAGSCSAAKLCCQGRDSGCVIQKESPNAIIESPRDKPCYCDHACLKLADCCDDFRETCGVVDCKVSEWSDWSTCDTTCGSGTQRRSRTIETPEKNGGKHCPRLDQMRSCRSFQSCRTAFHPRFHDRGLTFLSFLPSDDNQTEIRNGNEVSVMSRGCVAFTVVRASRGCSRVSSQLTEGARICVKRGHKWDTGEEKGEKEAAAAATATQQFVGIGRWQLSTSGSAARVEMNSSCHGKWIGDSRLLIDCDDPRCVRHVVTWGAGGAARGEASTYRYSRARHLIGASERVRRGINIDDEGEKHESEKEEDEEDEDEKRPLLASKKRTIRRSWSRRRRGKRRKRSRRRKDDALRTR